MKKRKSDYLITGLMLLCVGLLFLFLNRGLNTYLAVHFSLLHVFESVLLLILALLPAYQRTVQRKLSAMEEQLAMEEEEDEDDRDDWKPVSGAALGLFFVAVLIVAAGVAWFLIARNRTEEPALSSPVHVVLCVVIFILYACVRKWCSMKEGGQGLCRLMLVNQAAVLVVSADLLLSYTGAANITRIADLLLAALGVYLAAGTVAGLIVKRIRHPESEEFSLFLPMPFCRGTEKKGGALDWLERNTGISMRSLWSLKFLKVSLPSCVLGGVVLMWLSTCLVQVDACQQGALYRFGRLSREDILRPGLHFKLPVPFEVAKVYDVSHAQTMVVGYEGESDSGDNLWTLPHKGEEHKLLTGAGRELVAINLKISYRIDDLHAYLTNYTSPEEVLKAKGYEIIMHNTVNTDIDTIMSVDRSALSDEICRQLTKFAEEADLGVEVMGVTLASIHPPVEISDIYQSVVSAGIQKKAEILGAEGAAMAAREQAKADQQVSINQAGITKDDRVSKANAEVVEYNAGVQAYRLDPEAYRLDQYLETVQRTLLGKKKYILGEGVDPSRLYSGFLSGWQDKVTQFNGSPDTGAETEKPPADNNQNTSKPDTEKPPAGNSPGAPDKQTGGKDTEG